VVAQTQIDEGPEKSYVFKRGEGRGWRVGGVLGGGETCEKTVVTIDSKKMTWEGVTTRKGKRTHMAKRDTGNL